MAGGAARVCRHIISVQHIMDVGRFLVDMAVQALRRQALGNHLVHCPADRGMGGRVDVTGRRVAGAATTALGREIMQSADVVDVG